MDFRAALIDETRAFGDVIRTVDPTTWDQVQIPTCPGWSLLQLLKHVGRGERWTAQIVGERRLEALDPREVREGKPPADPDEAIAWLNAGAQQIIDAIDRVGSDARVWTFHGAKPAGWWVRRRLHEVTVHRADADLALGRDFELSPELAADAVTEWIDLATTQVDRHAPPLRRGLTLHLHATDDDLGPTGEWTIVHDEDGVTWSHDHTKGEVAVRGRAVDLMLAITRRRSTAEAGIEVFGDSAVWDEWLTRTPF